MAIYFPPTFDLFPGMKPPAHVGWNVNLHAEGKYIIVHANYNHNPYTKSKRIKAQDRWWDFGSTWETRVQRAIDRLQVWCDRKNAQEERMEYIEEKMETGIR